MTEKGSHAEEKRRLELKQAQAPLSEMENIAEEQFQLTRELIAEREKQARLTKERERMIANAKESERRAGGIGTKGSK